MSSVTDLIRQLSGQYVNLDLKTQNEFARYLRDSLGERPASEAFGDPVDPTFLETFSPTQMGGRVPQTMGDLHDLLMRSTMPAQLQYSLNVARNKNEYIDLRDVVGDTYANFSQAVRSYPYDYKGNRLDFVQYAVNKNKSLQSGSARYEQNIRNLSTEATEFNAGATTINSDLASRIVELSCREAGRQRPNHQLPITNRWPADYNLLIGE